MLEAVTEGVYFLYDKGELVYIGTSNNLYSRIGEHIREGVKEFDSFELYPTTDRLRLESFLIQAFHPKYNVSDGATLASTFRDTDLFPNSTIQEAIAKYDDYMGDPYVNEVADEIGTYKGALLDGLHHGGAPIYRIDRGYWRLDKEWYEEHKEKMLDYVPLRHWAQDENGERIQVDIVNGEVIRTIR